MTATENPNETAAIEATPEGTNTEMPSQASQLAAISSTLKDASQESQDEYTYYMPAEWEEHSACLILFPHNPDTFRVEKVSQEIFHLALTMATVGQEAVYFLCKDLENAKEVSSKFLSFVSKQRDAKQQQQLKSSDSIGVVEDSDHPNLPVYTAICPSNDTWARDTGPTFVFRRQNTREQQNADGGSDTVRREAPRINETLDNKEHHQQQEPHDLIGLDWDFNAYGGPEEGCYWPCTEDRKIARVVCSETTLAKSVIQGKKEDTTSAANGIAKSLSIHSSLSIPMILEGGSFHTDGEGTLLTTCECLLNPNRNPHLTQEQIETVLIQTLGVSKILWLPYGLDADLDTNGHVDNFCCFVRPGHVVLAWTDCDDNDDDDDEETFDGGDSQDEENDETPPQVNNYRRCRAAYEYLQSHTDAMGRTIEITKLYLPPRSLRYTKEEAVSIGKPTEFIRYPEERMAASYINFYIANKAILVPQFATNSGSANDRDTLDLAATDRKALETLQPLFPGRTVVGIPSREILLGGGNIHCQTQQVPSV